MLNTSSKDSLLRLSIGFTWLFCLPILESKPVITKGYPADALYFTKLVRWHSLNSLVPVGNTLGVHRHRECLNASFTSAQRKCPWGMKITIAFRRVVFYVKSVFMYLFQRGLLKVTRPGKFEFEQKELDTNAKFPHWKRLCKALNEMNV